MILVVHLGGKMFQFLKDVEVPSRTCTRGPCQFISWAQIVKMPIWLHGSPSAGKAARLTVHSIWSPGAYILDQ